jgi:hypothetical protein
MSPPVVGHSRLMPFTPARGVKREATGFVLPERL